MTAVLTHPDGDRSPPVTLTTDCPVLDVRKPLSHALSPSPFWSPLDLRVVAHDLVSDRGHSHEPTVHRIVQKRMICPPAVWVVVSVLVFPIEQPLCGKKIDNIGITVLDILPI
uniref:Uncharacterized protein n=1 Tax=uncultured marine group II/III euryarchaeote KM3_87_C01 TaxID=1456531 RepID=A0A075HV18_9EURY|nr:hypothetical protein [uncultured marine group II/III euryarchaeote KM3_87_C01]